VNARDDGDALTAREREVAGCIARGMSDEQITATLVISPNTVKTHVRSVLRKLDVKSRHQVAAALAPKITPRGIDPAPAPGHDRATSGGGTGSRRTLSGVAHMTWFAAAMTAVVLAATGAYQLGRSHTPAMQPDVAPPPVATRAAAPAPKPLLVMNTRAEDDVAAAADLLIPVSHTTLTEVTIPEPALTNLRKAASPSVLAILEDGVVTLDEVTAATRAAHDCTADGTRDIAGITLDPPAVGDPWHLFGFSATTPAGSSRAHEVYNTCNETYYRDVATAWGAGK
jgi:DNA-binding CsgD family transcriptional regulator